MARLPTILAVSCIFVLGGASAFLNVPRPHNGQSSSCVSRHWAGRGSHAAIRDRDTGGTVKVENRGQDLEVSQVLGALTVVMDPDLGSNIVSLNFIKNLTVAGGNVDFVLELTTPACPVKDQLKQQCVDAVSVLPFVKSVTVQLSSKPMVPPNPDVQGANQATGLSRVANVIAVSSCKGGVGKSTTAVNLAFALEQQGAKVGILDADVYGPSLPTMVKPDNEAVEFVETQIKPMVRFTGVDKEGRPRSIKLMSFGYVNPGAAAIMRGPMVIQLINQLITLTSWGELDYLIVDMPPGTGDIPLTLCQTMNITAAVIVTTPQRLSFADVVKGVDMFDTVNVPCVAVVENMAYSDAATLDETRTRYESSDAWASLKDDVMRVLKDGDSMVEGKVEEVLAAVRDNLQQRRSSKRIFGNGHRQRLSDMWGITNTVSLPLVEEVSASGDSGTPLLLRHPDSPAAMVYKELAQSVVREVAKLNFKGAARPAVLYMPADNTIAVITSPEAPMQTIQPRDLRLKCRCALCVEEMTGRQILQPEDVSDKVKPLEMAPVGNYALGVTWSDGHKSLYPYRAFVDGYSR